MNKISLVYDLSSSISHTIQAHLGEIICFEVEVKDLPHLKHNNCNYYSVLMQRVYGEVLMLSKHFKKYSDQLNILSNTF